jgi:hypothetical protein
MNEICRRYNKLTADQRKILFFGLVIVGAIAFLLIPSLSHFGRSTPPAIQKPSPAHVQPVQPALPATQPAAPVAPVITAPIGRFKGSGPVADRGICTLALEIKPSTQVGQFSGYSTLACAPLTAAQRTNGGAGLTLNSRSNAALALMLGKIAPTSLILSGTEEESVLKLHVDDSAAAPASCAMTDMTIKDFGGNAVLVKWNEQGCAGGSMTLGKLR